MATLQRQRLITKHAADDHSACGVEIDAVPRDEVRRITDDRVDVLLDLHGLVVVVLVQPHAGTDDIEDIENPERPIAFMRAQLAMVGVVDRDQSVDACLCGQLQLFQLQLLLVTRATPKGCCFAGQPPERRA